MAHELVKNSITQRYEMAYTGQKPWHKLGQEVTEGASVDVWMREAGMEWEAQEATLSYTMKADGKRAIRVENESHKLLYRSDTGEELGMVGADYNPVQPRDVLEFFRDLTEEQGWHIQTAGTLRGGKKLWAMAGRGDMHDQVVKGDSISGRLLLATSLDGSMKTNIGFVSERVVCANTMAIALNERGRNRIEISHRSVFDARAAKRKLGLVEDAWDVFMTQVKTMAETPIGLDEAREVLRKVFGESSQVATNWLQPDLCVPEAEEVRDARNTERALALFDGDGLGADHQGVAGTRWGLLNAVTELVDHDIGRTDDTRMDSAWFGRGKEFKDAAFRALAPALAD